MLDARARFLSTAIVPLFAMLPACVMEDSGLASDELGSGALGTAEQALIEELPLVSAAAATGAPALRALEQDDASGDLFALAQGHWVGECDILLPGQEEPAQTVGMERITEPTENPGEYTWTIIYRFPEFDQVRPYTITATATPGRYIIDEHNGILLPNYLIDGNVLVSQFQVQNNRLFTREVFRGNKYDIEFTISSVPPELTSDLGNGLVVDAFRVKSTQKCSLRRKGPRD